MYEEWSMYNVATYVSGIKEWKSEVTVVLRNGCIVE